MRRSISKKIVYYKISVEGISIPSQFVVNHSCFESYTDAVEYVENGWKQYIKNRFLTCCGRKIINEYINEDLFGYKHQLTIVSDTGFVQVVMLAVDMTNLFLR